MDFWIKFIVPIKMKIFIFLLIFISTVYSQNSKYYWHDVDIPLQSLLVKMGVPDGTEYQPKSGVYWIAYDFGDAAVIYIINKGFVSNIIYMKNTRNYDDINKTFFNMTEILISDGFFTDEFEISHFHMFLNEVQVTGNISTVNTEFVLTILVTKIKK